MSIFFDFSIVSCVIILLGGVYIRININKTKNHEFVYVIKDFYNNGSRTSKIIEKLGKIDELCIQKNMSRDEVVAWAKNYAKELTLKENQEKSDVIIPFSPDKIIDFNYNRKLNCGYLFLQDIYYQLKLDNICRNIENK